MADNGSIFLFFMDDFFNFLASYFVTKLFDISANSLSQFCVKYFSARCLIIEELLVNERLSEKKLMDWLDVRHFSFFDFIDSGRIIAGSL